MGLSERKACEIVGLCRATWLYEPKPESPLNKALRIRIREIAAQRRRFGSFRIWQMLVRQGWAINKKRVQRIYVEEKLSLRIKRRIKHAASVRVPCRRSKLKMKRKRSAGPYLRGRKNVVGIRGGNLPAGRRAESEKRGQFRPRND